MGDGAASDDELPVTLEQLRKLALSMGLGATAKASAAAKHGKKGKGGKKGKASRKSGGNESPAPGTSDSATLPAGAAGEAGDVGPPLTSAADGAPPVRIGAPRSRRPSMADGVSSRTDDVSKMADLELRRASGVGVGLGLGCDCVRRAAAGQAFVHENCSMAGIRVPGRRDRTAERAPVLGAEAVAARVADVTVESEFQMPTPDNIVVLSPDMALQLLIKYDTPHALRPARMLPSCVACTCRDALYLTRSPCRSCGCFRYTLVLENLEVLLPCHAEVFTRRASLFHVLKAYEDARRDAVHALELDSNLPAVRTCWVPCAVL